MNLNQNALPSCQPSTARPLEQTIVTLDGRLDHLFNSLHDLFARLDTLLNHSPHKPNSPQTDIQVGSSPVVEKLRQFNGRIEEMIDQVADIRARLEV